MLRTGTPARHRLPSPYRARTCAAPPKSINCPCLRLGAPAPDLSALSPPNALLPHWPTDSCHSPGPNCSSSRSHSQPGKSPSPPPWAALPSPLCPLPATIMRLSGIHIADCAPPLVPCSARPLPHCGLLDFQKSSLPAVQHFCNHPSSPITLPAQPTGRHQHYPTLTSPHIMRPAPATAPAGPMSRQSDSAQSRQEPLQPSHSIEPAHGAHLI